MVLNRAASASLANATQSSWSEEQILSACKRLADGKSKPADISAAIQGLNSARPETAEACKKALKLVDPSAFKTEPLSRCLPLSRKILHSPRTPARKHSVPSCLSLIY